MHFKFLTLHCERHCFFSDFVHIDRIYGKKMDVASIATLFAELESKGFGRLLASEDQAPHVFFIIDSEALRADHASVGLTIGEVDKALATVSKLPPKFKNLLGNEIRYFC